MAATGNNHYWLRTSGQLVIHDADGRPQTLALIPPDQKATLGLPVSNIAVQLTLEEFRTTMATIRATHPEWLVNKKPESTDVAPPTAPPRVTSSASLMPVSANRCTIDEAKVSKKGHRCPGHHRQPYMACAYPYPWVAHTCNGHTPVDIVKYTNALNFEKGALQKLWSQGCDPLAFGGNISVIEYYTALQARRTATKRLPEPTPGKLTKIVTPSNDCNKLLDDMENISFSESKAKRPKVNSKVTSAPTPSLRPLSLAPLNVEAPPPPPAPLSNSCSQENMPPIEDVDMADASLLTPRSEERLLRDPTPAKSAKAKRSKSRVKVPTNWGDIMDQEHPLWFFLV